MRYAQKIIPRCRTPVPQRWTLRECATRDPTTKISQSSALLRFVTALQLPVDAPIPPHALQPQCVEEFGGVGTCGDHHEPESHEPESLSWRCSFGSGRRDAECARGRLADKKLADQSAAIARTVLELGRLVWR